jgi:hypothetical protein
MRLSSSGRRPTDRGAGGGVALSAWGRGALYGGAITTMALLLAFGDTPAGPRSRRRQRDAPLPAPAWQNRQRR